MNEYIAEVVQSQYGEVTILREKLTRCKDCKHDRECTKTIVRRSKGGGNIYCPVSYCSEAEREEE